MQFFPAFPHLCRYDAENVTERLLDSKQLYTLLVEVLSGGIGSVEFVETLIQDSETEHQRMIEKEKEEYE